MITPAKWQTAEANQRIDSQMSYGDFRKKIVPHMKEVVYYPNSLDVFEKVYQIDGITYFCIDKQQEIDKCTVRNVQNTIYDKVENILKSYENSEYVGRTIQNRQIVNGETLLNIGNEIIKHIGNYTSFNPDPFKASEIGGRQYGAWINNLVPGNQQVQAGGFLGIGMQYIQEFKPPMNQVGLYYTAKTYKECDYYLQYLKTKFVRFFLSCYYSKLTGVICKQCFKFVPSPMILDNSGNRIRGEFDHIYTDDELYKTWNIPQKYIEVIEAVVKERDNNNYKAMVEKCYYLYNCGITFKNVLNTNYNVKERNSVGIGIFLKGQLDTIFSKSTKVYQLENLQNFLLNNQSLMDSNQKVRISFYSSEAMQDGVKPQNILKVLIKLYPKAFNGEWYRECLEMIEYFIPGQNSLDNYIKQNECIEKLLYICETVASLSIIVGSLCPQNERLSSIKIGKNCEFEIDGRNIIIETIQQ